MYIDKILEKFGMGSWNGVDTTMETHTKSKAEINDQISRQQNAVRDVRPGSDPDVHR